MNIFVGNLPASINAETLRNLFRGYGEVLNTTVATDSTRGRHGNVYMVPEEAARAAILELDLTTVDGHQLTVRECSWRDKHERRERCLTWTGSERRRRPDRRRLTCDPASPGDYPTTRSTVQ